MKDGEFLHWIADRLVHVYGESPNVDFVQRLRAIAVEQTAREGMTMHVGDPTNARSWGAGGAIPCTCGAVGTHVHIRYGYSSAKDVP
mgnify:CR=1 FL=1